MIDRISNYKNTPSFTGMSVRSVQNFIPGITKEAAEKLSKNLATLLPSDELSTMISGSNYISHDLKYGDSFISIGAITYKGKEDVLEKTNFLYDIADEIKKGILYA